MRRSRWILAFLPILAGQDGCEPVDDTGPLTEFACTLGVPGLDGAFVPLDATTTAELQLGFQGFLLVELLARVEDRDVPRVLTGAVSLTPEGMDPLGVSTLRVELARDGTSNVVTVFLDPALLSTYDGKLAHVALRLTGPSHRCVVEGDLRLVDDDPCIHTGDEPVCPEEEP